MKTLSGTVKLAVLALIGLSAVFIFRGFAGDDNDQPPFPKESDAKFVLRIHNRHEVKDEQRFKQLLSTYDSKLTRIHMRHQDNKEEILPTPKSASRSDLDIKTDKTVTSEVAKNARDGEFDAVGVHVTQQVASRDPADIAKVLAELKP